MSILSHRLSKIKPSPTLAITQKARQLQVEGHDVISLSAGEPDFPTPDFVRTAAKKAIDDGFTKYTAVDGVADLKKAIQQKFARENGLNYETNQIIVSVGAKQVLYNALIATLNPGDGVIIPAPYWVSYVDMVTLGEGVPVIVSCSESEGFKITPEKLEAHITPKTKWLILNSPGNPSGAVYSEEELVEIGKVVARHSSLYVLSDDIYEHILYTGKPYKTLAQVVPDCKERILTVNGVSKSYAMTGWRIGYGAGDAQLIKAMANMQSQSTSNPCSIAQMAALAALQGDQSFLQDRQQAFQKRRDFVTCRINAIPGLSCSVPEGAFYVYVSCRDIIGKTLPNGKILATDSDLGDYFITQARVAVVQGEAFGLSPYFRISYATDEETLGKALDRIEEALALLR